jgi:hypothetical protein
MSRYRQTSERKSPTCCKTSKGPDFVSAPPHGRLTVACSVTRALGSRHHVDAHRVPARQTGNCNRVEHHRNTYTGCPRAPHVLWHVDSGDTRRRETAV